MEFSLGTLAVTNVFSQSQEPHPLKDGAFYLVAITVFSCQVRLVKEGLKKSEGLDL